MGFRMLAKLTPQPFRPQISEGCTRMGDKRASASTRRLLEPLRACAPERATHDQLTIDRGNYFELRHQQHDFLPLSYVIFRADADSAVDHTADDRIYLI